MFPAIPHRTADETPLHPRLQVASLRVRPLPVFPGTRGQCALVRRLAWKRPKLPPRQVGLQGWRAPQQQEQPLRWVQEQVHGATRPSLTLLPKEWLRQQCHGAFGSQRRGKRRRRLQLRRVAQPFRFRTEHGRTDQILLLSSLLLYAFRARFDMFPRMPCKYFLARLNWLLDVFKSIPNCAAISLCLYPSITYMLNTIPYPLGSCAMAVANSSRVKSNSLNASKSAGVAWTSSTSS